MLKRKQVEKWFPDAELVVVPLTVLPVGLADPAARVLLTEVGIPESFLDVIEVDTDLTQQISQVGEIYQRYDEDPPDGVHHLYYLGFAGQPFLTLDGRTGRVGQVHRRFGARPLASSLEAFLRVLGSVSGDVQNHQRKRSGDPDRFPARLTTDTLKQLRRSDPTALPEAEPAWRELLADIAAGAS